MNKLIKKSYSIILFLLVFFLDRIFAQESSGRTSKSDSIQKTALLVEWEIFNAHDSLSSSLLFKKSEIYKSKGFYEKSYQTLLRVECNSGDSIFLKKELELVLLCFLIGRIEEANSHLLLVNHFYPEMNQNKDYLFLSVQVQLELGNIESARKLISNYCALTSKDTLWIREKIPNTNFRKKSIKKAQLLSAFLPGSGQFYTHNFMGGLGSIFLQAASTMSMYWLYANGYYLIGTFTGLGLEVNLYRGGIINAGRSAEEYNEVVYYKFLKNIRKCF